MLRLFHLKILREVNMNLWLWSTIFVLTFAIKNYSILAVDEGNIHLMKDEIAEALKGCTSSSSSRNEERKSLDDFTKKATEVRTHDRPSRSIQGGKSEKLFLKQNDAIDSVYDEISADRPADEVKLYRGKSNFDQKQDRRNDMKNNSNSSTWSHRRDDPLIIDNDYDHERRFDNRTRTNGTKSTNPLFLNNQNNTDSSLQDANNNFNSRGGARFRPKDFKNLLNARKFKAVSDLNFTSNLFDPYASRGYAQLMRRKRFGSFKVKTIEDECLSQCVFANMQVTDSRGIPKEALLIQRVQEAATSTQARTSARGQLQSCFQDLRSESEDDGCSYSNKLEQCMLLQLHERHSLMMEPANLTDDE